MLGKQRNNQATDQQFMESAWKNMAEILDQEMPVEKEERRIGWLSIAAILVVGFVGGLSVMWGLQRHEAIPMAAKEIIKVGDEIDLAATKFQEEDHPISIANTNNTTAYNPKSTLAQSSTNVASEKITNHTSMARATPKKQISSNKNFIQNEITEKPILDHTPIALNAADRSLEVAPIITAAMTSALEHSVADISSPIAELPTLGLTNLPTANTVFSIDNDIDLPKNKNWRTGVYAGAIVAGKADNGLEAGMRIERKMGKKWAVESGLGFRAMQLGFLNGNNADADLASTNGSFNLSDPDVISVSELQEIANRANADQPNYQLTIPLSVIFRPTGKLRLALGMSWAYRLNKLKDASSFSRSNNVAGDLAKNSFSGRLDDFRLNLGVGYYLNPRTGLELAYSEHVNTSNNGTTEDALASATISDDVAAKFLQLSLVHYF